MTAIIYANKTRENPVEVIVDAKFFPVLNKYTWSLTKDGYVATMFKCEHMANLNRSRGKVLMHQMVMTLNHNLQDVCLCDASYVILGLHIDHKDNNKLNNCISNLQYLTDSRNNSKAGDRSGHSSQYNGVHWNKTKKKWQACYWFISKTIHIGYFDSEIAAAKAVDKAFIELGLDRMLNFPS